MGLPASMFTARALSKPRRRMTHMTPLPPGGLGGISFFFPLKLKFSSGDRPFLASDGKSCDLETPIRAPWRMPGQGGLTGGCHTSSAGSGLLSHTSGCTCSKHPTGSSLHPRAPEWASCSHTLLRGTTETQQGRPRAPGPLSAKESHLLARHIIAISST